MNFSVNNQSLYQPQFDVENVLSERDENLAKIEIAILIVIFIVTVLGNSIVLLALWTRRIYAGRKKLSRMYFFILHLSIADLVTALLSDLPQLAWDITFRFKGGWLLCKIVKFGQLLGPYLSSYILMATAVDRYQAICYPLTYCSWTSRRSKLMVWTAWITSLIFCIPQIFVFSYQEAEPNTFDCWATFEEIWGQQAYVTWYSVSVFIIPLVVLTVTYSSICRMIWKNSVCEMVQRNYHYHVRTNNIKKRQQQPLISRAKVNTVKQTVAVVLMYIICSAPFITVQLWAVWDPESQKNPFFEGPAFTILTLLYSLNSCVNPWIYLAFNSELPKVLIKHYLAKTKKYRTADDCHFGIALENGIIQRGSRRVRVLKRNGHQHRLRGTKKIFLLRNSSSGG
ncbi:oxytocin receptor-like isoform X2 [Agrilus planipennis]|uniref:Oxytocin receptor-like isoform X2 n=1 Tax=Agrilus planipennis TaxID=224129 RepID=A0A1W4XCA1_AGRPL|nr:oxytocin receptor-like isoform X2 [Agrilus planipennis]